MGRLVDVIAPARFGGDFRRLLGASFLSNTSDGIALTAGGLLVAAQTRQPSLVALAALVQRLPWVLFGLHAGVLVDRLDRRILVAGGDLARAAVLALLVVAIVTDRIDVVVVLVVLFLLGSLEVVVDTTTRTLLPMLVDGADLGVANSRLMASHLTVNQLVGPPLGAALFAVGMVWPFAVQVACLTAAAGLLARLSVGRAARTEPAPMPPADEVEPALVPPAGGVGGPHRRRVTRDIVEGVRWLWSNGPIRTLTLTIVLFNLTFGAAWSLLVLLALERLGLDDLGFGVLAAMSAIGGLVGASAYARLERRFDNAVLLRTGLVVETVTHLVLAVTTTPAVAMGMLFLFGIHISVWGTIVTTIRQRSTPEDLQGRVSSVYSLGMQGGLVIGAAMGGVIADVFGVTGPYWFAFIGSAALVVILWRPLEEVALAPAVSTPG